MHGSDEQTGSLFPYLDIEDRVPGDDPLRAIRTIVSEVLERLNGEFAGVYSDKGGPSIAPERLLRALLLQTFCTLRSVHQPMEQLNCNLPYRRFARLVVHDAVPTVFTKNCGWLLEADPVRKFLVELLCHERVHKLLPDEHFSVDAPQVQAWAWVKSFRAKDGSDEPPDPGRNGERSFHDEKRSNATHASPTNPQAELCRKGPGKDAKVGLPKLLAVAT